MNEAPDIQNLPKAIIKFEDRSWMGEDDEIEILTLDPKTGFYHTSSRWYKLDAAIQERDEINSR